MSELTNLLHDLVDHVPWHKESDKVQAHERVAALEPDPPHVVEPDHDAPHTETEGS